MPFIMPHFSLRVWKILQYNKYLMHSFMTISDPPH
jgi:hypothetical protein